MFVALIRKKAAAIQGYRLSTTRGILRPTYQNYSE
jgi:hypothetical protein